MAQWPPLPELEFARPAWLLLIPILWLTTWLIARRVLGGWRGGRQAAYLVIRCIVFALIVCVLAEPSLRWRSSDVALIVVRDMSRSIPADQQRLTDDFLAASYRNKRPNDRVGVVSAAKVALVQSLPVAGQPWTELGHVGDTDATNLQQAAQLATAVLPPDAGGRVLIISDGNQTSGSLAPVISMARLAGVPIDVAAVEYNRAHRVYVRDVVVPAWARAGDTIDARVLIDAGVPTSGRLSILMNGEVVDLDPATSSLAARIDLATGPNVFTVPLRLTQAASHEFEAHFEPIDAPAPGSATTDVPELQRASGVTFTSSRGRVLVLTEDPIAVAPFLKAIRTDGITVDAMSSADANFSPAELVGYDAVVLANQPASNFSQLQQEQLRRFVHDGGGGLIVLGGPDSLGAGGWIGSPLADALPVVLDPPRKREMPMGALAVIIDASGSMSAPVSGTNLNQQQIANEAAILGIRALSRLDDVTVISFSGDSEVVVPLTRRDRPDEITRRIRNIGPSGGTNLFPAIDAAAEQLAKSKAGVKHIIILTDGDTIGDPNDGISRAIELKRRGITISTVAIGDQVNSGLLQRLAAFAGGRSHQVQSANSLAVLPQIFIKEARTVSRTLIWEGAPFTPTMTSAPGSLRGLTGSFPDMRGYVVTADRGGLSTISLRSPQGDPLLAQWQHGLGRVTVFAGDAASRWTPSWIEWGSFIPFWQQQLKWTMRPMGDPSARVAVQSLGDRARISVELLDDDGTPLNFAQLRGRVMSPASTADPRFGENAPDLSLRQVGPGRYQGDIATESLGVYIASLRYEAPMRFRDGQPGGTRQGTIRAAIIRRGGDEMRAPAPDREALWQAARQTNGRIFKLDSFGADLWARDDVTMPMIRRSIWIPMALAALAVFLVDVAARRITIDPDRIRLWMLGLLSPAALRNTQSDSMSGLAAAKSRATAAMRNPETASAAQARKHERIAELEQAVKSAAASQSNQASPADHLASPSSTTAPTPPAPSSPPNPADTMSRLRAAKKRSNPN